MSSDNPQVGVSDMRTYRKCRQLWDYTSKLRQNRVLKEEQPHFLKGRAIHKFMEHYYTNGNNVNDALMALSEFWKESKSEDDLLGSIDVLAQETEAIIRHYLLHVENAIKAKSPNNDSMFSWRYAEQKFLTPIKNPITRKNLGINYAGTIDGIVTDTSGNFWLWEHKTSSNMDRLIRSLQYDDQSRLYYGYARSIYGEKLQGFIYNVISTTIPENPKVLKGGTSLSQAINQKMSFSSFNHVCKKKWGKIPDEYRDFAGQLWQESEPKFFRRYVHTIPAIDVMDTTTELYYQATEMTGKPHIYKARDTMICDFCPWKTVCYNGTPIDEISKINKTAEITEIETE